MTWGKIITNVIVLLVTLVLLVKFFFDSHIFIRDFLLFWIFVLAAITSISAAALKKKWSWPLLTILYAIMIINFIYLYFNAVYKSLFWYLTAVFFAIIGFLVSTASIK